MAQHLIDTDIVIGRCRGCWAYVMTCLVSGYRVIADPVPLTLVGLRGNLMAGRDCYSVISIAGRPTRLQALHGSTGLPQGRQMVAQHPCRAGVEPIEAREHAKAGPVLPLRASEGYASSEAFRGSQNPVQGISRALGATPHPSDYTVLGRQSLNVVVCDQCQKPCGPGTYVAIERGSQTWARHIEGHCGE